MTDKPPSAPETQPAGSGDYEVGFKKTPEATRFQKGRSGNPNGRPRRRKQNVRADGLNFGAQLANQLLLEEAYRPVTVREGDQVIELPAIQAAFRAMNVSAIKGNRFAQQMLASLVQQVEADDHEVRTEYLRTLMEYKYTVELWIEEARARGAPEPQLLPHPDDIIIDFVKPAAYVCGPSTKEEKAKWDELFARRDAAKADVDFCASNYRRARDPRRKAMWLFGWHDEQCHFDIINDNLPKRYRVQLENRSWNEGASRPGSQKRVDWPGG